MHSYSKIICSAIIALVVLPNIIFVSCTRKAEGPVLAKFNGGVVTQAEYIDHYLLSAQYKPDKFPTEENLKEILVIKAMEKMTILEAKERKLDLDSSYSVLTEKNETRILFYRYMRQEIIEAIITDSLINKFYAEYSPQYKMRYIMRPVLQTSTEEFEKTQKDTIDLVYKKLQAGENFEALAKKYSQDITTNQKGGDLGFVIRESLGDAVLRTVMDTLQDDSHSKPVRGFEGYYILYKGEKRDVPVPELAKIRDKIWASLYRTRRHLIRKYAYERFQQLAPKYHYQINQKAIDEIKHAAGGDEKSSDIQVLNFQALTTRDLGKTLAEWDGGKITAANIFEDRKKAPDDMAGLNDRLIYLSQQFIFARHAKELGIDKIPEVVQQLDEIKNSVLHSILYHKAVKEKAQAMIAAFKEANPDSQQNYFQIERSVKDDFEASMKKKYHFQLVTDKFNAALQEARNRKEIQNQERAEKK
ncbi:peptidylprolyl isomerase [candidate division KSB1 bacterium]|nr:peptidylprolyl isomerase [candidate division KSB1 bacterium]